MRVSILNFQILDGVDNGIFGCFQDLPSHNNFIKDAINLMKIEDNI